MAEWKEGDWECPDCGKMVFASRETCMFCERAASGNTREPRQPKDGDWDCPDCGRLVFEGRESCIFCEKGGGQKGGGKAASGNTREPRQPKEGDWDCPDCGRLVFAGKDSCIFCEKGGGQKGGGQKGGGKSSGGGKLSDSLKMLSKHSPAFKEAWTAYADLYAEGWYDAGRWANEDLVKFADYMASAVQTSLHEDGLMNESQQETTSTTQSTKRTAPAGDIMPDAKVAKVSGGNTAGQGESKPAAPKKLTMKKAFADEIRRLNASGALSVPLRPGAVAAALAQLDQDTGLSIFASLDAKKDEIEDPNEFIRDQAAEAGQ